MQIIRPCFADPTDCVLQGAQDQLGISDLPIAPLAMISVVEGDMIPIAQMPTSPVPSAMIGQSDWYGVLPRQLVPMAIEGGIVNIITIGTIPVPILVDPIQQFLNQTIPLDLTGEQFVLNDICGFFDIPTSYIMQGNSGNADFGNILLSVYTLPPAETVISGYLKNMGIVTLPPSFGNNEITHLYTETTQKFFISGVTRDNSGSPLGNCLVFVLVPNKLVVNQDFNANPVVAVGVSDSYGNYSIQVGKNDVYQLIGYFIGNPDIGGITIDTITPVTG
jgi:hypothetical protein